MKRSAHQTLLTRKQRPHLRIPWYPLLGLATLVSALVSVANAESTDLAVQAGDPLPSQHVEARIVERWSALIDGDMARAYAYSSPSYRAVYTLADFTRASAPRGLWEKVEVLDLEVAGEDAARAVVEVYLKVPGADVDQLASLSVVRVESWVRRDGQWWYVPKR